MNSNGTPLTPAEAWADFWNNVKPIIWDGLDNRQRNRLIIANKDARGERKDHRTGNVLRLGVDRTERLLNEFANGRYRIEKTMVFYLNNQDE